MRHVARRFVAGTAAVFALSVLVAGPTIAVDRWITTFDLSYRPAEVTISPGDTVTFVNDDEVPHDAVGNGWSTVLLGSYDSDAVTFDRAGTYRFTCSLHPEMRGTIVVRGAAGEPAMTDPPTDALPVPLASAAADRSPWGLGAVWLGALSLALAFLTTRRAIRR